MSEVGGARTPPLASEGSTSIHSNARSTVLSRKRAFVIVESLYIAGFEARTKSDPTHKRSDSTYYVYEIVLENEAVGRWTVWRRYSDFAKLYQDIQKWAELRIKLEGVSLKLPSKLTIFKGDEREFVARRAEQLQNAFLMPIFSAVGGADLDFWHHPIIMAFFEIPVIKKELQVSDTPSKDAISNELGALYGDAKSWMNEFRKAEELVLQVGRLVDRQRKNQSKEMGDASQSIETVSKSRTRIVSANTQRIVDSATTKLDALEKSLEHGVAIGIEPEMYKPALSKLRRTLMAATNELPCHAA